MTHMHETFDRGRIAFILCVALGATASEAIVIRHDKNDALYRALAANARYDAVGRIEYRSGSTIGTGTGNYIGIGTGGKKWLVTAGHVVDAGWDSGTFTVGGRTYQLEVSSLRWWTSHGSGFDDIGVARILDPDNTLNVAPAKFWNDLVAIPADLEQRLIGTTVGFGLTGTGTTGPDTTDNLKRAMQNRIDGFDVKFNRGASTLRGYACDFDRNDADSNRLDRTDFPAANFEEGQRSSRTWLDLEGQGADGDSGGGLFVDLGGMHVMIGVTSAMNRLGTGTLGAYGSFTRYSPFNRTWATRVEGWTGIKAVPEPSTLALFLVGGAGMLARRKRRQ